jgi:hypothetical protein
MKNGLMMAATLATCAGRLGEARLPHPAAHLDSGGMTVNMTHSVA